MGVAKTIGLKGFGLVSTPSRVAARVPTRKATMVATDAVGRVANLTLDMALAAAVISVPVAVVGGLAVVLMHLVVGH